MDVATNALEHNFVPMLVIGVMAAASVGIAAYEVTQAYKEQGIEAAAKQLGIEIVVGAAGAVTGATAGRLAGKVAYRYGGKVYHSLSEAVDVVFTANPGLKLALGRFANQIKDTAAWVGNTKAGQLYHRANQSAENLVNRASDKVGQLMGRPQKQGTNILTGEKENKGKEIVGKKTSSTVKEDKWVRKPSSIQDQMTLEAAKRGEGERIMKNLNDPMYKGMEKWELRVKSGNGKDSVVHYVKNPLTGELLDFKFKKRSAD